MSQYESELNMEEINSASLLIENVKKGSTVLEFGPSTGRMTKYLKEELDCKVYIVELDKVSFLESIKYAEDGICDDIETMSWAEKFKDIQFDYIIFADVLEHLKNPKETLLNSKKLLKYDGELAISVPNIAHNSIIANLTRNIFHYNKNGLLDETHIHFFTYNSIKNMIYESGFMILKEKARYLHEQENEFPIKLKDLNQMERYVAEEKEFGDVYQFVFLATKFDYYQNNKEEMVLINDIRKKRKNKDFNLYVNEGLGFNENLKLSQTIGWGENILKFDLSNFQNINKLRIDFIENEKSIVKLNELKINEENLNLKNHIGNYCFNIGDKYIFDNLDSHIILDLDETKVHEFEIKFFIQPYFEFENFSELIDDIKTTVQTKKNMIQEKENIIQEKESIIQEKESIIQEKENIIQEKENIIQEKENIIEDRENAIQILKNKFLNRLINKLKQ